MAVSGEKLALTFEKECRTAADFARRFRVLASMSETGVTFTQSPDSLRQMAALFDVIDQKPAVLVVEVPAPLPKFLTLWFLFMLGNSMFVAVADPAWALLALIGVRS